MLSSSSQEFSSWSSSSTSLEFSSWSSSSLGFSTSSSSSSSSLGFSTSSSSSSSSLSSSSSSSSSSSTEALTSSSSSEVEFTVEKLEPGEAIGVWLRMDVGPEQSYNADDSFTLYAIADEEFNEFNIHYTYFDMTPSNIEWQWIRNKTHHVRVTFDHVIDSDYYAGEQGVWYSAYVNKQHVKDFQTNQQDIFVGNIDSIFDIDIYAIPHEGFYRNLSLEDTGRSAKIEYKGLDPEAYDIDHYDIEEA